MLRQCRAAIRFAEDVFMSVHTIRWFGHGHGRTLMLVESCVRCQLDQPTPARPA
jgi:hypothetical protein